MTEKILTGRKHGFLVLILTVLLLIASLAGVIYGAVLEETTGDFILFTVSLIVLCIAWIPLLGLKVLAPQEALVITLFGKYVGTVKGEGFYWVNPFSVSVNPAHKTLLGQSRDVLKKGGDSSEKPEFDLNSRKISLKIMTLSNARQKINDSLGNPIEIGIAVTWRVVDTAKAVFDVDNYKEYLSLSCDIALRKIVKLYPYDLSGSENASNSGVGNDEDTLRGSTEQVAIRIKKEIQLLADKAGIEIIDARITYLAYATEIAAIMLQRQQAAAIVDARKMIVDGAVGMVEMALERLSEKGTVELDEERKAAMVSNLLVVLCGNRDAQPVVNSGSLY